MENSPIDSIEEGPDKVIVKSEMSGTEHVWKFNRTGKGDVYPTYLIQGEESYRLHNVGVPGFVREALETDRGIEIVDR